MNILITAGGTTERIDNVRTITNSSTGRLGAAIAEAFAGAAPLPVEKIYYLCGLNAVIPTPAPAHNTIIIRIGSVNELIEKLSEILTTQKIDVVIHSMAVSDYTVDGLTTKGNMADSIAKYIKDSEQPGDLSPEAYAAGMLQAAFSPDGNLSSENKISSDIEDMVIVMKKTPKVISLIKKLQPRTLLVGFKLLSNVSQEALLDTAYRLLMKNDCDLVLANDLSEITPLNHKGYLIDRHKAYEEFHTKTQIAEGIVNRVSRLLAQGNEEN